MLKVGQQLLTVLRTDILVPCQLDHVKWAAGKDKSEHVQRWV